jgi:hypothetical protein
MSLRQERNKTREAILEGRFISQVLAKEGKELDNDIKARINSAGFDSSFWGNRNFTVNENTMTYTHLRQHRFIDMKSRSSLLGKRRKKFYAIHNKPIYGHANEIVKELTVGFTDGVREQMMQLDGSQI